MVAVRGRQSVDAMFASAPDKIMRVLRGAGRAGGAVIVEEAKERASSEIVREGLRQRAAVEDHLVKVTIDVKSGWARSLAVWAEYGTDPHFISVDDSVREGRTVRRLNMLAKSEGADHSLVIGGRFVGRTVLHPGARAVPFLRPAMDLRERDAVAAAQAFLDRRIRRDGIDDTGIEGDDT